MFERVRVNFSVYNSQKSIFIVQYDAEKKYYFQAEAAKWIFIHFATHIL